MLEKMHPRWVSTNVCTGSRDNVINDHKNIAQTNNNREYTQKQMTLWKRRLRASFWNFMLEYQVFFPLWNSERSSNLLPFLWIFNVQGFWKKHANHLFWLHYSYEWIPSPPKTLSLLRFDTLFFTFSSTWLAIFCFGNFIQYFTSFIQFVHCEMTSKLVLSSFHIFRSVSPSCVMTFWWLFHMYAR